MPSISGSKKRRGRLTAGSGATIGLRLYPELDARLEKWIGTRPEPRPSRPEAIRSILAEALDKPITTESIAVDKILGSKVRNDGNGALVGLTSGDKEYVFALLPEHLTSLALTALKAKTVCDAQTAATRQLEFVHAFPCERWEIRLSADGKSMMLGFLVAGGAWIRLQVPSQTAGPMRDTLETIKMHLSTATGVTVRN